MIWRRFGLWAMALALTLIWTPINAEEVEKTGNTDVETEKTAKMEAVAVDRALMVVEIVFQGSENVPEELLRGIIQTKVDQEISPDVLSKDIKSLYKDTINFSDIAVDVEPAEGGGLKVVYQLKENPKIGSVNIIGNEQLKHSKIKKGITLKPDDIYRDIERWKSEQAILTVYKESGYYLATLQTHVDRDSNKNTVAITFEVNEGQRIEITKINFIGNDNLTSKSLAKQMKTREGKHFDEGLFDQDLTGLRYHYEDNGFSKVDVVGHEKHFTEDKTGLTLDITVDEGPQFFVGTYDIEMQHAEKPAFSEKKIRDMLNPAEGEIFNRQMFQESLAEIQKAYEDKGYLLTEVVPTPTWDETDGIVDFLVEIQEGSIVIIGKVQINGLEKTKENVIRRELNRLGIKENESLDVKSLRKARQRFFQMGSFIRNVDFIPSETQETRRDLIVNISETSRTGMFSLGGGYGTEGGVFGVAEVGENNLFGRAYRVHLKGELGTRDRHTGELRFNTPWIFGTPTRLSASLYDTKRLRRYYGEQYRNLGYDRYVYQQRGASATIGRPIAQDIDLSVRFKNEHVNATRDDVDEIIDRSTRSITLSLSRDTRDYRTSLYNPVTGAHSFISYEYSGGFLGAENEFQKYSADSSWFLNTWGQQVVAVHARAGYLNSRSSDSTFLFLERYLIGGIDTVRGYEDFEIFPSNNNPNGGNKVFYANFEYRIPLASQLSGVVFFDIGQVWDESTPNIFKDLSLKKGAGVGIRFDLMGMLARLEWGYGFDREIGGQNAPSGKFHFTIGPGF